MALFKAAIICIFAQLLLLVNGAQQPAAWSVFKKPVILQPSVFSSIPSKSLPVKNGAANQAGNAKLLRTPVNAVPGLEQYLYNLRGGEPFSGAEAQAKLANAVAGVDYPILNAIPAQTNFSCDNVQLAGYYADVSARCQVFHRCDAQGLQTSYLCPNLTVFNQLLFVCDYFYNIICDRSPLHAEWANSHMVDPLIVIQRPHSTTPCNIQCIVDPCDSRFASCPNFPSATCVSDCCVAHWFQPDHQEVTSLCVKAAAA